MLMLSRRGVICGRCLRVYRGAVSAAVMRQVSSCGDPGPASVVKIIDDQLSLLEAALQRRSTAKAAAGT